MMIIRFLIILMLSVNFCYADELESVREIITEFDNDNKDSVNNNFRRTFKSLNKKAEDLEDLSVTATAEEINQVCSGVGATVTAANLTELTDGSETVLHKHAQQWILLNTYTASSSASINITSQITSTYDDYMVIISNMTVSADDSTIYVRVSTNNGSSWISGASDYRYSMLRMSSDASLGGEGSEGADHMIANADAGNAGIGNASGENYNATIMLNSVNSSSSFFVMRAESNYVNNVGRSQYSAGSGLYDGATSAINAIQFYMNSGSISTGTFKIYGLIKS